jgi:hypothetical protein
VLGLAVVVFTAQAASAQRLLDKKIDLYTNQSPLEYVLETIEERADFVFSYPSDLINGDSSVTLAYSSTPVSIILKDLFGDRFTYLERGSFVIIKVRKNRKSKQEKYAVSGKLVDANTGAIITNASIYEVNSLKATTSGAQGDYDLKVKADTGFVEIAIAKENYKDTLLRIRKQELSDLIIALEPVEQKPFDKDLNKAGDSSVLVQTLVNKETSHHMANIRLYEEKFAQVSFLPTLGTNKQMSGKTSNHLSFNALAGYSFALKGVEVGGLANIVRQHMYGAQVAGFTNVVGGKTRGIQVAGFSNVNRWDMIGLQVAGFSNTVVNQVTGIQVAGFMNSGPAAQGVQVAGFLNTTWAESHAYQLAGFVNYSKENSGGQIAGFVNVAGRKQNGVQAAGFFNYAGRLNGLQVAGFMNFAKRYTNGVQISSFLNFTHKLNGVQIAMINICDTVESGVSIGLLNFVKHGILDLELQYSPTLHGTLALKTGTGKLYNILSVSHRADEPIIAIGYGLGSRKSFKSGLFMGVEAQAHVVREREGPLVQPWNILNQIHPSLGWKWAKNWGISAGPVLNAYYTQTYNELTQKHGFGLITNPFYTEQIGKRNLDMMLGYRVAMVF